jgi:hypothetical protein
VREPRKAMRIVRRAVASEDVKLISRLVDDEIQIYDDALDQVGSFPIPAGVQGQAVSSTADRLVYAVDDEVVCTGAAEWRFDLGPRGAKALVAYTGCTFSLDDTVVWVYSPDALADRGARRDRWIALDSATGAVRESFELDSAGQGGQMIPHPDGDMLLDVGEGQDGSRTYRVRLGGQLSTYPWHDRVLIDLSPSGRQFMTVDHGQEDVAFHTFPGGEVELRVEIAPLEDDPGDAGFEWTGGYLDETTVVAVVAGVAEEDEEEEWWRHCTIDVRTGEITAMPVVTVDVYDLQPLGDGTYLSTDTDGSLRRQPM